MPRDRFEVEREQRLYNRVMVCCATTIILILVLLIACAGCSTQKHSQHTVTDSISSAVDSTSVHHARTDSGVVNWLTSAIQGLRMQLVADSLTLPFGAVLHAPRLMTEADNVTVDKGTAAQTHREQSDSAALRAATQAIHEATGDETKDTTAVYEPPDPIKTVLTVTLLAVAAFAICRIVYRRKT